MMQIHTIPHGTPEWHAVRLGIPTASNFSKVLAKGEGKVRNTYMVQLAAEIFTGESEEGFKSADMLRGNAMEPEARDYYAFLNDVEPQQVGFITNGAKGGSPDTTWPLRRSPSHRLINQKLTKKTKRDSSSVV
jgi:hypothetical protein